MLPFKFARILRKLQKLLLKLSLKSGKVALSIEEYVAFKKLEASQSTKRSYFRAHLSE